MQELKMIVSGFAPGIGIVSIEPFGNGWINTSYKVTTEGSAPDYVLQRINHQIFTDVELLQRNIETVTSHIRRKLAAQGTDDIDRKVLRFIADPDGKTWHFDGKNYWRLMVYIPRSRTFEAVTPRYAGYAGEAFGQFQRMLADLPDDALGEVIPDFHNIEFRLRQLREAVAEDRAGRLAEVSGIVAEIERRAERMCLGEQLHREGKLPKRICHCDTKVNNMLFDENGDFLCVIDLDTVMPSYVFSDFGDFLRTGANTGAEDDKNLDNINFDMDIFRAFTAGYLGSAAEFLTPVEIENLPYGATLFPYMQSVRFLADYLNGDTYYKILYPDHNLVRTRAQMRLLESAEACLPEMKKYIDSVAKNG